MKAFIYFAVIVLFLVGCGSGGDNSIEEDTTKPIFSSPTTKSIIEGNIDILTVKATDEHNVTYSIVGGDDQSKVQIDSQSGILTFITEPDFENPVDLDANNIYVFIVGAEDNATNLQTQTITITITDNENDNGPVFVSQRAILSVENAQLDFSIDATGAIGYGISGEDSKRFDFNRSSGKLTFLNFIPDFENPSDADRNGIYEMDIFAISSNDINSTQALTITITDDTSDNSMEENRIKIYKTGADDGIIEGDPFGADRNFTAEIIGGDRVIYVGNRLWQDSAANIEVDYTFDEAQSYCSTLDYADKTDWRVPNRHEMYEIINYNLDNTYSTTRATIDDIFINSTNGTYRTSDNVLGHSGQVIYNEAFVVSFRSGASYSLDRGNKSAVRCVRGDTLIYNSAVNKDADEVFRDTKTGLQWAKPDGPESMADAKERCENLDFANYDDWRLPNISELHTIMPSTDIASGGYPYGKYFLLEDESVGPYLTSTKLKESDGKLVGRYIGNYWNYGVWSEEYNASTPSAPLGRDVQNDKTMLLDNSDSIYSYCVRGGYL